MRNCEPGCPLATPTVSSPALIGPDGVMARLAGNTAIPLRLITMGFGPPLTVTVALEDPGTTGTKLTVTSQVRPGMIRRSQVFDTRNSAGSAPPTDTTSGAVV